MSRPPRSLDVIRVVEPCTESWDAMTGDARVRFCSGCRKHVYDLSAITRSEAVKLVCESAGPLCLRFSRTPDGRVRTLEYQVPPSPRRGWRFWAALSTCAASLVAGLNGYLLLGPKPPPPTAALPPVMPEVVPQAFAAGPGGPSMVMGMPVWPAPTPPAGMASVGGDTPTAPR